MKLRAPQGVAQDHRQRTGATRVGLREGPTQRHRHAVHAEVPRRDAPGGELHRGRHAGEIRVVIGERPEGRQARVRIVAQGLERFGWQASERAFVRGRQLAQPDVHERFWLQEAVNDAEDHRAETDAQRQRSHGHAGEEWLARKGAGTLAEVLEKRVHRKEVKSRRVQRHCPR